MKVKLLRKQTGKMNRHEDWPKPGTVVDLWEPKAQHLISVGDAEPVSESMEPEAAAKTPRPSARKKK